MVKGGCANPDCNGWPEAIKEQIVFPLPDNDGWFMMVRSSKKKLLSSETFITIIYFCPWCGSPLTPPEEVEK